MARQALVPCIDPVARLLVRDASRRLHQDLQLGGTDPRIVFVFDASTKEQRSIGPCVQQEPVRRYALAAPLVEGPDRTSPTEPWMASILPSDILRWDTGNFTSVPHVATKHTRGLASEIQTTCRKPLYPIWHHLTKSQLQPQERSP